MTPFDLAQSSDLDPKCLIVDQTHFLGYSGILKSMNLLGWFGEPWVIEHLHQHSEIELNLIASGELHYLMGGTRVVLRAAEVTAYWAITPHRIIYCQPASKLGVLHIPLTEFLRWDIPSHLRNALLHGTPQIRRSHNPSLDCALFERWAMDLQQSVRPQTNTDPIRQHRAVMLEAEAFLHRFAQFEDSTHNQILDDSRRSTAEQLAQVIAQEYTKPITATTLARDFGLNPNYAMTVFKQAFGLTIHQFLTQHRLAHAQRLLITQDSSVLDVAFESGFQSLARFYAVFAQASKMSPRLYRARYRSSALSSLCD